MTTPPPVPLDRTRSGVRIDLDRVNARVAAARERVKETRDKANELEAAGHDATKRRRALANAQAALQKLLIRKARLEKLATNADEMARQAAVMNARRAREPAPNFSKEMRRVKAQIRNEQAATTERYRGIDIQTDRRTAGGSRDLDVIDTTRAGGFRGARQLKPEHMFDRASDRRLWREKAIAVFSDLYHAAHCEEGLASPSLDMKVDHSSSGGRLPRRAVDSIKYAELKEQIGSRSVAVLEHRIVHHLLFEHIAREMGIDRRQAAYLFNDGLDVVAAETGIERDRAA